MFFHIRLSFKNLFSKLSPLFLSKKFSQALNPIYITFIHKKYSCKNYTREVTLEKTTKQYGKKLCTHNWHAKS